MAYSQKFKQPKITLDVYGADVERLKQIVKKLEKGKAYKQRIKLNYYPTLKEAVIT